MRPDVWIIGVNVPDVPECYGHPKPPKFPNRADLTNAQCEQCNGGHEHDWVSCQRRPFSIGTPVRCHLCGARKCDTPECIERRGHRCPHLSRERVLGMVGH